MEYGIEALLPPGRERPLWRWITVISGALSFIISLVAFYVSGKMQSPAACVEAAYASAQLILLHMPVEELPKGAALGLFHIARALAVTAWTFFGLVVFTIILSREGRRRRIAWGGNHTVICGLSGAGLDLLKQAKIAGEKVIAIEEEAETAAAIDAEECGASVLAGSPADPALLRKAGMHHAKYVLAASPDDSANIAAIVTASKIDAAGRRAFVHIADPQLRTQLRRQRTFRSDGPTPATVFDVFDHSARLLLRDCPLDHMPIRADSAQAVQIIVIGFGLMGEAVLTRAALMGHYANLKPLEVIVIDRSGDRKERLFRGRYPHFKDVAKARFLKLDAQEPATQAQIVELCRDPAETISTIMISFNDPLCGYSIALSLAQQLEGRVPIRLRLNHNSGISALLSRGRPGGAPSGPITAFGSLQDACAVKAWLDPNIDIMARAFHQHYLDKLPEAERSRPGNRSAYAWERLDDDLKESNRLLADHVPVKLRAVGCRTTPKGDSNDVGELVEKFEDDEVELLAQMEHRRWMAERLLGGWWTPGEKDEKDIEKRISPRMVEWEKLPPHIQDYDRNFVRAIPGVLKLINQEIRR